MGTTTASIELAEDAYEGDAQYAIAVNGAPYLGGTATFVHPAYAPPLSIPCNIGDTIAVTFTNDAYGGSSWTDRNLYVRASAGGVAYPEAFLPTTGSTLMVTVGQRTASVSGLYASLGASAVPTAPAPVPAEPLGNATETLMVGPGQRFAQITDALVYMYDLADDGTGNVFPLARRIAQPKHVILTPAPDGYYDDDTGSHASRWPSLRGWPACDGFLYLPVTIEGQPGSPPPMLRCTGPGALYKQQGWFNTTDTDATFRRLHFTGCQLGAAAGGIGNASAIRFVTNGSDSAPWSGNFVLEDVEIDSCDSGILGGCPGQTVTLRRVYVHDCGNNGGRTHNIYIGYCDALIADTILSTRATVGHLLKSRAANTTLRNTIRLLGNGGTESACLDLPDGGVFDASLASVVMQKSPTSDASWAFHYGGENQDAAGVFFHVPSSVVIRDLTIISPTALTNNPSWGVLGFANQTGQGFGGAEDTAAIRPDATGVKVFGLTAAQAGLPCTILAAAPALDLSSPVMP